MMACLFPTRLRRSEGQQAPLVMQFEEAQLIVFVVIMLTHQRREAVACHMSRDSRALAPRVCMRLALQHRASTQHGCPRFSLGALSLGVHPLVLVSIAGNWTPSLLAPHFSVPSGHDSAPSRPLYRLEAGTRWPPNKRGLVLLCQWSLCVFARPNFPAHGLITALHSIVCCCCSQVVLVSDDLEIGHVCTVLPPFAKPPLHALS